MLALLTVSVALIATQASAVELAQTDRSHLLQLADRMDRAWTAGDAQANAQLFATGATARFGSELLGEGREAIRKQFEGFFKDRPPGLRHVTKIERIEALADDLAVWDAEVRVEQQRKGQWTTVTTIRNFTVVVRQSDGWRIRSVRAFPIVQ